MIRSKTVEIRETDLETANDLLKDPHWTFVTAFVCASADNNVQKVKYVLKKRGTYDDINMENSKELSASSENINRPPKMIDKMVEYASREFPAEVRNQNSVSIKKLAEAVNNIPDLNLNSSSKICNLKLSELIYVFAEKEEGD